MRKLTVLLVFVSLFASAVESRTFKVGADPVLDLSNVSGNITVTVGDSDEVVVNWNKTSEKLKVNLEQSGDKVTVSVDYPQHFSGKGDVEFTVSFPGNGKLEVTSVSGDIDVTGVHGKIELQTVSGAIHADDIAGKMEVQSVSGSLDLKRVGAGSLDANAVSGPIHFAGSLEGDSYQFNTTSGPIDLALDPSASFTIDGNSLSGDMRTNFEGLKVTKEKYSGARSIEGEVGNGETKLEVNTISGSITIN